MRLWQICMVLIMALWSSHASATKPIVADLAIHSVDINHDFKGLDILLFGARNDIGRIVVVLRGTEQNYTVRKKNRVFGLWMNTESKTYRKVPNFYAIGASANLDEIRNSKLLQDLGIGQASLGLGEQAFETALLEEQSEQGLFQLEPQEVSFWGETLFRTTLRFPKTIERGWYTAEVYLFNGGQLSAVDMIPIEVSKIGIEAMLYDLATNKSWLYGLICVFMAFSLGWIAHVTMRKI